MQTIRVVSQRNGGIRKGKKINRIYMDCDDLELPVIKPLDSYFAGDQELIRSVSIFLAMQFKHFHNGYPVLLSKVLSALKKAERKLAYGYWKKQFEGEDIETKVIIFKKEYCELVKNGNRVKVAVSV